MPPDESPHSAPWQGPPPERISGPRQLTARELLAMLGLLLGALVIICGIAAWFLAQVIP